MLLILVNTITFAQVTTGTSANQTGTQGISQDTVLLIMGATLVCAFIFLIVLSLSRAVRALATTK